MDNTALFFQIFNLHGQNFILDKLMIFGADYLIYIIFAFTFYLGLKGNTNDKRAFLLIILGAPIAILLIKVIHIFYFEPRPFVTYNITQLIHEQADAAFPSRHATIISVIAMAFTYYKSKWTPFFLLVMVWIGLSRIFVGVHYPLDVLGGFLTGVISLFIALQFKKILKIGFLK